MTTKKTPSGNPAADFKIPWYAGSVYSKLQISTKTALALLCLLHTGLVQAQGTVSPAVCERTQQVRDELVRLAPVDECSLVTAVHLAGILGNIVLRNKGITTLKVGDFQGLTPSNLLLDGNQLTTLPTGVFSGLTIRGGLNLSGNDLTTLPADVFSGLNLNDLDLSGNDLTTLPAGVFSRLILNNDLRLSSNGLATLPADVFSGLTFRRLFLNRNDLTTLPAGVFSGLNLGDLLLNGSQLTTLPAGVFAGLNLSGELDLSFNLLETLPAGVFSELTTSHLFLNNNRLETLPAGVFAGLNLSGELNLSFNDLTTLPAGVFSGLNLGGELDLSFNLLETLPARVFSGLNLGDLLLNGNDLTTLPAGVFSGLNLSGSLFLQQNPTTLFALTVELEPADGPGQVRLKLDEGIPRALTVPVTASGGTASPAEASFTAGSTTSNILTVTSLSSSATTVSISIGELPALPDNYVGLELKKGDPLMGFQAISPVPVCDRTAQVRDYIVGEAPVEECALVTAEHLASIGDISLINEGITALKAGDFQGLTLSNLNLGGNQLTMLPAGVFSGLALSSGLDLARNDLTTLPANIFSGLDFITLWLTSNQLTTLSAGVFSGLTLSTLFLSFNDLKTLPADVFSGLTLSGLLDISSNDLETLPAGIFNGLTLGRLFLHSNDLTTLETGVFSGLTISGILNLSDNQLTTLPAGIFSGLTLSGELNLERNPGNLDNPFLLTVELERGDGPNEINLKLAPGIPGSLTVPITVSAGSITPNQTSFSFAPGDTTSATFTVAPAEFGITIITIGDLPDLPAGYLGLKLEKEAPLAPFADVYFTGGGRNLADAKVLYYALSPELNDTTLATALNSVAADASDAVQDMLIVVNSLARETPEVLDFNTDGNLDIQDAAIFYYALALPASLGNGTDSSGSSAIREAILGPFMRSGYEPQELLDILRTINGP